jgi:thiol-disulfide isomerase/thioredoxin
MILKKFTLLIFWLLFLTTFTTSEAEQNNLRSFVPGSYQQILTANAKQPFMLVIWSINCSSCLKDMALLNGINKAHPDIKMIMLATDDLSASADISKILEKSDLANLENWVYADENTQKLQYEIDPKWYGELPRTYFFNATHQREGISGVLSRQDYETRLATILK